MEDDLIEISTLQSYLDSCCLDLQVKLRGILLPMQAVTCCVLSVINFDLDVINFDIHPEYFIGGLSNVTSSDLLSPVYASAFKNFSYVGDVGENGKLGRSYDESYSNETFFAVLWYRRSTWEVTAKSVAVAPVVFIAVVGNMAVIRIILKARLFRNPVNMFILNMSIADLLCALLFPWIILIQDLYQSFQLGAFICKTEGFILLTLMLTSVLSLTAISYDRLKAVVFPFNKRMGRKSAKRVIWTIWVLSAACASPLVFWRSYHVRIWKDFKEKWCKEDMKVLETYWLIVLILLVWIPLSVLTVSYTAIVYKLDALERRQKDHPAQVKLKSKVVRMLFAVVILFAMCWLPFSVLIILRNNLKESQKVPSWLRHLLFVSHYLMFVNSAINPIIYGLKNDNLKREIRLALPACMRTKEKQEISAVYDPRQPQHGPVVRRKNNKTYSSQDDDEDSPASAVSLQRKISALEDLGLKPEDFVVPQSRILSFVK